MEFPVEVGDVASKSNGRFQWIVSDFFPQTQKLLLRSPTFSHCGDTYRFTLKLSSFYYSICLGNTTGTQYWAVPVTLGIDVSNSTKRKGEIDVRGLFKVDNWVDSTSMGRYVNEGRGRLIIYCEFEEEIKGPEVDFICDDDDD